MRKEINALLASDSAIMEINQMFRLRRWQLHKDTDIMHREGEYLQIEFNYSAWSDYRVIESRDVAGIVAECQKAMTEMMADLTKQFNRQLGGGYGLGRIREV